MIVLKKYLILMLTTFVFSENVSSNYNLFEYQSLQNESTTQKNKTIDKLIQEQTDLIKQIVSNSRSTITELPTSTYKTEIEEKELKEKKEKESINELFRKCQNLLKTAGNKDEVKEVSYTRSNSDNVGITTVEAFGPVLKPQFLEKPKLQPLENNLKQQLKENLQKNDFASTILPINGNEQPSTKAIEQLKNSPGIMTSQLETTTAIIFEHQPAESSLPIQENEESESKQHSIITISENSQFREYNRQLQDYLLQFPIQQIKFEPYVLQKIVLSSGKELFYWYKKYPTIPQFLSVAHQQLQEVNQQTSSIHHESKPSSTNIELPYKQTVLPQLTSNKNDIVPTTEIVQHEIEKNPEYEIDYTEKHKPDNNLYRQQLKFVMSMIPPQPPIKSSEESANHSPQFDAYAYYPKNVQPSTINIRIPYVPTYHMIKTLSLPKNVSNNQ